MTAGGKRLSARSPRFDIEITPEILATSCQRDSGHCMIADALKAARPDARHILVDLQTIRFTDPAKGHRYVYLTPRDAQDALIAFDQGEEIQPFTLTLMSAAQVVAVGRNAQGGSPTVKRRHDESSALVKVGGKTPPIAPLAHGSGLAQAEAFTRPNISATLRPPKGKARPSIDVGAQPQPDIAEPPADENKPAPVDVGAQAQPDIAEPPADVAQPRTRAATEASSDRRLDHKVGRRRQWGLRAMKR